MGALVKALARRLDQALPTSRAVFVTEGLPGVQETFARHCGDGSRVWNVLPNGSASSYSGIGRDIHAGANMEERKHIFASVGDIYVTFEGGPSVAQEAKIASTRGA